MSIICERLLHVAQYLATCNELEQGTRCCGEDTTTALPGLTRDNNRQSEQSDVTMSDQDNPTEAAQQPSDAGSNGTNPPKRVFKMSDEFLMFKFKIEMCSRKDRHDWKICPYAHPGEVARRRHPRGYTAVLCPAKTAASCPRREQCTFAHNPFEFWLHPDRFKTSLCNQGPNCDRPICFFAHKDEEVRRLAHGLEAAGPDDYVYATASTPDPSSGETGSTPPPPPPPPPRFNLTSAGSAGLSFLQSNAMVAAAAAAAAAAAGLANPSLLLAGGAAAASPHQMLLLNGEDSMMQGDASGSLCGGSWINSNSDPSLLSSLAATGRQLSSASPVPVGPRNSRTSLPVAQSAGLLGMSLEQSTAAAGSYGCLDPKLLAGSLSNIQLNPLSHAASGALSLGAPGLSTSKSHVGSAPAGYMSLQGADMAMPAYQQLLQQQLQLEQQQQMSQQQQLLTDQLLLQQLLLQQQQQQGMVPGQSGAGSQAAGLQQLAQQQLQQHQLQQLQQQLAAQQQQQQQVQSWASLDANNCVSHHSSSMLISQPLATSAPPAQQLLWLQHQQQDSKLNPGSYGSSGSASHTEGLAAALAASAPAVAALVGSQQASMLGTGTGGSLDGSAMFQPPGSMGSNITAAAAGQSQGMLKWSSSILSKQHANGGSGAGAPGLDVAAAASSQAPALPGAQGVLSPGSDAAGLVGRQDSGGMASLEQLNGLLQLVQVSSSAALGDRV